MILSTGSRVYNRLFEQFGVVVELIYLPSGVVQARVLHDGDDAPHLVMVADLVAAHPRESGRLHLVRASAEVIPLRQAYEQMPSDGEPQGAA